MVNDWEWLMRTRNNPGWSVDISDSWVIMATDEKVMMKHDETRILELLKCDFWTLMPWWKWKRWFAPFWLFWLLILSTKNKATNTAQPVARVREVPMHCLWSRSQRKSCLSTPYPPWMITPCCINHQPSKWLSIPSDSPSREPRFSYPQLAS